MVTRGSKQLLCLSGDVFVLHVFRTYSTATGRNALEKTYLSFSGNQNIHLTTTFSRSSPLLVRTVITIIKQSQATIYNFCTMSRAELNVMFLACMCSMAVALLTDWYMARIRYGLLSL